MKHRFTILIPTRDRLDNIVQTVKHLLKVKHDSFCILISDNCSNDGTYKYLKKVYGQHPNIRIIQTEERLPMSLHWDFAIRHVESEFLTILGDDDGLHYDALNIIEKIFYDNDDIDFIRSNTSSYQWPTEKNNGTFTGSRKSPIHYKIQSSKTVIEGCRIGARSYTDLPMLYNGGFIRAKLFKDYFIKNNGTQFYKSIHPDIYSAVYFSLNLEKYIYVFQDLAVNGTSKYSNGVSTFTIEPGDKKDESQKFITENKSKNMTSHAAIPTTSLGPIVPAGAFFVYECGYQCLGKDYIPPANEIQKLIFSCKKTAGFEYKDMLSAWIGELKEIYQIEPITPVQTLKLELFWLYHKTLSISRRIYNRLTRTIITADTLDEALEVFYNRAKNV